MSPTQTRYQRKMLRLLSFPKAKPESGPGCLCCLASRLSVRSQGAGGPRRAAWRAPGGCAAVGSDGSRPVYVRLPPPGTDRRERRRDVGVFMKNCHNSKPDWVKTFSSRKRLRGDMMCKDSDLDSGQLNHLMATHSTWYHAKALKAKLHVPGRQWASCWWSIQRSLLDCLSGQWVKKDFIVSSFIYLNSSAAHLIQTHV